MHKLELDSKLQKTDLEILDDLGALERDPATAELIRTGRTMGCFYIESPAMRSLFRRMCCERYEDVVAASSIIRPGVAESGMMREYVARFRKARGERREAGGEKEAGFRVRGFGSRVSEIRNSQSEIQNPKSAVSRQRSAVSHQQSEIQDQKFKIENTGETAGAPSQSKIVNRKLKIEHLHSKLAELLTETYGVMVYQEDVIKVVHELGGLSLGEADVLRRAMSGKAGAQEAMASLTERFFAGCRARGVAEPVIAELWRQIETFARFSFCKGHSAAFAVLSYQVAYLKAHYPAEFMAAVLSNGGGFYGAAAYIQECRRMGLRVLGPDVNESEMDYTGKTEGRHKAEGKRQKGKEERQNDTKRLMVVRPSSQPHPTDFLLPFAFCLLPFSIGCVRVGFAAIKNFPLDLARRIVGVRHERPFDGLDDFLRRVRPGHEATEKLIRVGAFDRFGVPRERLFLELDIDFRRRMDHKGEPLVGV